MTPTQATMLAVWMACITLLVVGLYRRPTARQTKAPLQVDPHFPPTRMVYLQGEGEPECCARCGRELQDGDEILHWPQPAKLICVKDSAQ